MTTCFTDPAAVFVKAFKNLAPGGYLEMQEIYFKPHSYDGTVDGTALQKWNNKLVKGAKKSGKDWHCTPNYTQWFVDAGFVNVVERQFVWPQNTWPKGRKQKEMGLATLMDSLEVFSSASLAVFTRHMGMTPQEVEEELVDVRRDMRDSKFL